MKKFIYYLSVISVVFFVGLAVTSCKDSDDESNNGNQESEEERTESAEDYDKEEVTLAGFLRLWTDEQPDEIEGSLISRTFEPSIGLVIDESKPLVRAFVVGTLEAADEYAIGSFSSLGIDFEHPDGFRYSSSRIGSVAYHHGGANENVLATIDVNIQQLPGMTELQLLKQYPHNADVAKHARYQLGDVLKKQVPKAANKKETEPRYFLCVSNHGYGGKARFVTFNDHELHKRGSSRWGRQNDSVYSSYSTPMASDESLASWLKYIVMDDNRYSTVLDVLKEDAKLKDDVIRQLIPENQDNRKWLVQMLFSPENVTPELIQKDFFNTYKRHQYLMPYLYTWEKIGKDGYYICVRDRLLANICRWSTQNKTNWDFWVPYIACIPDERYTRFKTVMDSLSSQKIESNKHFGWVRLTMDKMSSSKLTGDVVKEGRYHICLIGMHWTHDYYKDENNDSRYMMFNFLRDWANHDDDDSERKVKEKPGYWGWRCITSSEISFTDNGKKADKCEEVWVQSQH